MSFEATRAVWEKSEAPGSARMVLLCIAYHYNDDKGMAWPSIETIAQETRLSTRQVSRAIAALVDLGELVILTKGNGRGRATEYDLSPIMTTRKDDTVSTFTEIKDDICDIKDDILSIKDDTVSPQLKEIEIQLQPPGRDDDYLLVKGTFENEINPFITPIIADSMRGALVDFSADAVVEAIGIAAKNGKRNWGYVEGILNRWRVDGRKERPAAGRNGAGINAVAINDEYGGFSL